MILEELNEDKLYMKHLECDLEQKISVIVSLNEENLIWTFKIIYCAVLCLSIIFKDDNGKVIDMEYMYMYTNTCICVHIFMMLVLTLPRDYWYITCPK